MISEYELKELLSYESRYPLLSMYLNTDPAIGSPETFKLHMRTMLKEIDLPADADTILRYFEHEHNWSGRSVAVFSSYKENYFKAYSIAVPFRNRVRVDLRPYVKPLADIFDSYGGYGVILLDKQSARLFYFHLGELQEQEGFRGESVRRTKKGGGSQATGRRGGTAGQTDYVEEVAERNVKEVVESATRFFAEKNVRRILLGGTDNNIAIFRSRLPKSWQTLVVGDFPISMTVSHAEVLERAMEVGRKAESRREAQLAAAIVTNAAKGRGGVVGLEETLRAIHEGRLLTLMIRDGFRAPGSRCKSCGFISAERFESCPYCGGEPEEIQDAVDLGVRKMMQAGGEVEVLPRDQESGDFDQIGGLLRY